MTPGPWIVTDLNEQTLVTDAHGHYVAVVTMRIATLWTMDLSNLRLMVASPKLLASLKESTDELTRLATRYPRERGLKMRIQRNTRLIAAIEEEEEENGPAAG